MLGAVVDAGNALFGEEQRQRVAQGVHVVVRVEEKAAHVVVVEEAHVQLRRRHARAQILRCGAVVVLLLRPQIGNLLRALLLGRVVRHLEHVVEHLEVLREVEDRVQLAGRRVAADERVVAVERFSEHEEAVLVLGGEPLADALGEHLPEFVLHVLHGVDAEAVQIHRLGPAGVRVDHLGAHLGELGGHVLQPTREIAQRALLLVVVVQDAAKAVVRAGATQHARRRHAVDVGVVQEKERRAPGVAQGRGGLHAPRVPVWVIFAPALDR